MQRYDIYNDGFDNCSIEKDPTGRYVSLEDAMSAIAARDQHIAQLEQRIAGCGGPERCLGWNAIAESGSRRWVTEQAANRAWLAAWDAEYRAQEWQRSFVAFAGAARVLHEPLEQRIAAQSALLERAEAALQATTREVAATIAWLGDCDHEVGECHRSTIVAMEAGVATLAAIREQREEK